MKKTLFTLACAALAAPAFAGEAITEPITVALPDSVTLTSTSMVGTDSAWQHGKCKDDIGQLVTYYQTNCKTAGFYVGGNNNSYGNPATNGEGTLTTTSNVASVVLDGRSGVGGDNFVMVLKDNALTGKVVNSLTLTGSGNTDNTLTIGGTFVVAVYNDNALVGSSTVALENVKTSGPVTTTLTLPNETFTDAYRIMIGFRGAGGGATTPYTISGISLTATPEPATATLSLLALAGLASRRRRH